MEILRKDEILIRKGTKVLSDKNHIVTLQGDVYVNGIQTENGVWNYLIGEGKKGTAYQVSNGSVEIIRPFQK